MAMAFLLGACRARKDDARVIVVGGDVNHEAVHEFEKTHGRHPNREEQLELHRVWIDNEVLYREGLKGRSGPAEPITREQVIFEALRVLDAKVRPSSVSDEELQAWFESHRGQYVRPARFDLEDATVQGSKDEQSVRALVEELNRGGPAGSGADVRVLRNRPEGSLVQSYGVEVVRALAGAEPGRWLALPTPSGFRPMRLLARAPATQADFATQREEVRKDLIEARVQQKRSAAVRALWQNYRIEFAEKHECIAEK